jgi:hypothetical protein
MNIMVNYEFRNSTSPKHDFTLPNNDSRGSTACSGVESRFNQQSAFRSIQQITNVPFDRYYHNGWPSTEVNQSYYFSMRPDSTESGRFNVIDDQFRNMIKKKENLAKSITWKLVNNFSNLTPGKYVLDEYLLQFLSHLHFSSLSDQTISQRINSYKSISAELGLFELDKISSNVISLYFSDKAPAKIEALRPALHNLLKHAVSAGILISNPCEMPTKRNNGKKVSVATLNQMHKLIENNTATPEICKILDISRPTLQIWKKRYSKRT